MRVFESPEARRSALFHLGVVAVAVIALGVALVEYAPFVTDPEWVRTTVDGMGPYAPLAFIALQATQVVLAPIPGQTLAVVGGYLFGPIGAVYSVVGVAIGSSVVLVLSRRYGRPFVERVVAGDVLDRFDTFVDEYGLLGLVVVFSLPTFPDDAICAIAGLTSIRLRTILVVLVVARTPTFVLATLVGDGLAAAQYRLVVGILIGVGVSVVAVYVFRERLLAALPAKA
ncbi:TVP38/TMEM64 family protein [Salinigranum sp. GCM10025319]|uniref:TVP38/TMEM64 family protein n=1 Tax=Salinigranum sp. GCM10025319 TaxID=3252687 RepID=UPI00360FC999